MKKFINSALLAVIAVGAAVYSHAGTVYVLIPPSQTRIALVCNGGSIVCSSGLPSNAIYYDSLTSGNMISKAQVDLSFKF